jgi:hypothetical protein
MKDFPTITSKGSKALALGMVILLGSILSISQTGVFASMFVNAYAAEGASIQQCGNGPQGTPATDVCTWQNGNLHKQNSHFREGESVPYKVTMTGLATSAGAEYHVTVAIDVREQNKAALDFFTYYDRADGVVIPAAGDSTSKFPIPALDGTFPNVSVDAGDGAKLQPQTSFNKIASSAIEPAPELHMWGGTMTGAEYVLSPKNSGAIADYTASSSELRLKVTFTPSSSTAVLAFGGHIASRADWGLSNSFGDSNASPYHARIITVEKTGAPKPVVNTSQDRSLKVNAIITAELIVIKHVINNNLGQAVSSDFRMHVSATNPTIALGDGLNPTGCTIGENSCSFDGVDSAIDPNTQQIIPNTPGVIIFFDAGTYAVTETQISGYAQVTPPSGFSTDCSGTVNAGQTKVCNIWNDDVVPPAGTIVIKKVTILEAGGTPTTVNKDFGFTHDFKNIAGESIANFDLNTANIATSSKSLSVAPGTYNIAENVPSGWVLSDRGCTDPTNNSNADPENANAIIINMANGETVECTFTNARPIVKVTEFGYSNEPAGTLTGGIVTGTNTYTLKVKNFGAATTTVDIALGVGDVSGVGTGAVTFQSAAGAAKTSAGTDCVSSDCIVQTSVTLAPGAQHTVTVVIAYSNVQDGKQIQASATANYTTNSLTRAASGSPAVITFTVQED